MIKLTKFVDVVEEAQKVYLEPVNKEKEEKLEKKKEKKDGDDSSTDSDSDQEDTRVLRLSKEMNDFARSLELEIDTLEPLNDLVFVGNSLSASMMVSPSWRLCCCLGCVAISLIVHNKSRADWC